ncbi:MAG: hypothetical protein ACFB0E_14035 [Leptolyngbyaceae cyanobacterium]
MEVFRVNIPTLKQRLKVAVAIAYIDIVKQGCQSVSYELHST